MKQIKRANLESMQRLREVGDRSPSGIRAGGSLHIPSLNPVGQLPGTQQFCKERGHGNGGDIHQSTNWTVRLLLTILTVSLTSLGVTSPLYSKQQDTRNGWIRDRNAVAESAALLYFPIRGSHLT